MLVKNPIRLPSTDDRRFEQTVTRQGKRIQVAVEFGSEQNLPSTADRDKFLALMKIVNEERARQGVVQNAEISAR
jgi:hypothetical protein